MIRNPGRLPGMARGKRINVVLANGLRGTNWPADGQQPPTRWSLTGSPYDIKAFEIAA
jgi:hypothetical protein